MKDRKMSARLSLAICSISAIALIFLCFVFPDMAESMYQTYYENISDEALSAILKYLVPAFYCCVPFSAAALYMLIRLLINAIKDKPFTAENVKYLRYVSWCCYAVMIITYAFGYKFPALIIIAVAMMIVGTLIRVVKNIMETAVQLREENDLTI